MADPHEKYDKSGSSVASLSDDSDDTRTHPQAQKHDRRGLSGWLLSWTATFLFVSYLVFSVSLYTLFDDKARLIFWFLYLTIATLTAGITALEAYDGLTTLRDARKSFAKLESDTSKPEQDDASLPTVHIIFDIDYEQESCDYEYLSSISAQVNYPVEKLKITVLQSARDHEAGLSAGYFDEQSPNLRFLRLPATAIDSLSSRLLYCLSLESHVAHSTITAVFGNLDRLHPNAIRSAVSRFVQNGKVSVVQGRSIMVPQSSSASLVALEQDMTEGLLKPGQGVSWSQTMPRETNTFWLTETLRAASSSTALVSCDGMDLAHVAINKGDMVLYDGSVISYRPCPPTSRSYLRRKRNRGQSEGGASKWSIKKRLHILYTLPGTRIVYHAILQYFCLVFAMLITTTPHSAADLADLIYFRDPVCHWFIILGLICMFATSAMAFSARSDFVVPWWTAPVALVLYPVQVALAAVYFNETGSIPQDVFSVDTFEHTSEKGWNIYYREGATAENLEFVESEGDWSFEGPSWLNMNVSAATPQHLVNGAQLQTVRQDIQYGTFRTLARGPDAWAGGSVFTMKLEYNETSSAELGLLNQDISDPDASMSTSVGDQLSLPFSTLNYTMLNSSYGVWAWNFQEWRIDWNSDVINWLVNAQSSYPLLNTTLTSDASLVDVPTALYLKHWSNGNSTYMQGPPQNTSAASIGWVRMFFNSSYGPPTQFTSAACDSTQFCSVDDMTLRVTTPYSQQATVRWSEDTPHGRKHATTAGIAICGIALAFSAALVLHALSQKWRSNKHAERAGGSAALPKAKLADGSTGSNDKTPQAWTTQRDYEMSDMKSVNHDRFSSATLSDPKAQPAFLVQHDRSSSRKPLLPYEDSTAANSTTAITPGNSRSQRQSTYSQSDSNRNDLNILPAPPRRAETFNSERTLVSPLSPETQNAWAWPATAVDRPEASTTDIPAQLNKNDVKATAAIVPEGSVAAANPGAKLAPVPVGLPQARTRVDYLAGLVAVCSILVSLEHWVLTYTPSVVMEYLDSHYASEYWARRTIEPFFFNDIWVGLFFTTSTRFLCSGYLRTGNLRTIAEKIVCRVPRLMIPITAVIVLQYFLMDLGATKYLEYIPSITWSTWPQTVVYPNFGWFMNETLQLFYLIPNAAPNITGHYGTGVLWTIPVQLQNSWLVLLGVVIVREIKTPWKRFGYYAFCIANHWYAMSWGSYFWFGLMLADLDITYKYRKYIHARSWLHYPLLNLAIFLVLLSLANDLFSIWTGWTFSTNERGIHPEPLTGLPIGQTALAGYPDYTEPKLHGLVFAVCLQYVVELSTWTQAVLSTKAFLWLFPHVFTIYLIHGLVHWSIGSLVCVYFASVHLPYWLNMLLTCIICYVTLFAVLPIITPVMEMLGKEVTRSIWVAASEEPPKDVGMCWPLSIDEVRDMVYRRDDEGGGNGSAGKRKVMERTGAGLELRNEPRLAA
ncbi:hypothetical protein LTR78_006442 [Recurvomyces mirabilis]|uniref:GH16 domain-containing protein n=1 Tax=Recurvomyces mirabilis TaxID=574656 RepID=A0AAE1BZV9_9PEZI|nr:hypothetical protein LTR78_006442 [Recurvomyces mirabilis]KAK5151139.1 hypothetical protein LTS14_009635 [Recurvomyces mirabilis]